MRRISFRKIVITILVLLVLFIYAMFLIYTDDSVISKKIDRSIFESEKISELIQGEWDFVCPIVELVSPEDILKEAGYVGFEFSNIGNGNIGRLLDGMSGVVVINIEKRSYALYLVFDRDKIVIWPPSSTEPRKICYPYSQARLVKQKKSNADWLYLRLEEHHQ